MFRKKWMLKMFPAIVGGLLFVALVVFQSCVSDSNTQPANPSSPITIIVPPPTATPTPMATSCATVGYDAPAFAITPIVMNQYDYVGIGTPFTYSLPAGQTAAQSFDQFNVYAANSSGVSAALELAVINLDSTQSLLADGTLQVPPGSSQWFAVSLSGAVTNAGTIYLLAHAMSPSLSIGSLSSTTSAGVTGIYGSTPLPASLALVNLTTPSYALNVHWCTRILVNGF